MTTTQNETATLYYPLSDAITAADLTPGMFLVRVAQRPGSQVFAAQIAARVLEVEPFTQAGQSYIKVTLEPEAPARSRTLNLDPARPVQAF